jgi:hypothetical protein
MTPQERSITVCQSVDHDAGCLTCADAATWMRVLEVDSARELALCIDDGEHRHTVDIGIAGAVGSGDRLLVHAGAALLREST